MKWAAIIISLFISLSVSGHALDSVSHTESKSERKTERKLERQKAKIERQRLRIMNRWDQRTMGQKKVDKRALVFLIISAGVLVNTISHKE
jgi:hypothetical protein